MSEEYAIQIEHLTKVYKMFNNQSDMLKETFHPFHKRYSKDFYALNDISFNVKKGDTVGLVGKNGAGKSTILKIITGVLTATSGSCQVNGRIASLLELGAGFNPEMTGLENIYLSGTIMGYTKPEIDSRLEGIIAFADIGDFLYQPVKMYSSGMFARLAFAVNASVDPDILIIDEALAVGDVFFQNKCFRKLEALREKGITILFVSHDIASVKQLCNKAVWLENGQVRMQGESEDICNKYFNETLEKQNKMVAESLKGLEKSEIEESGSKKKINTVFTRLVSKEGDMLSPVAEVMSFFIADRAGNNVMRLEAGKHYNVHILIQAHEQLQQGILGFNISTPKGIDVVVTNTFWLSRRKNFSLDAGELLEVVYSLQVPYIKPGTYLWDVGLAKGTQETNVMLSWLHCVCQTEIINEGSNALGLVDAECSFEMNRLTKNEVRYV